MIIGSLIQSEGNDNVAMYAANYSKLSLFNKKALILQMFKSSVDIFPKINIVQKNEFYDFVCTINNPNVLFYGIQLTIPFNKSISVATCLYDVPLQDKTYFSIIHAETIDKAKNTSMVMFNRYIGKKYKPIILEQTITNNNKKFKVINSGIAILNK